MTYDAGLAFSLRNLDLKAGMVMGTVPVRAYEPNPYRVEFIPKDSAAIFQAIANDQPIAGLLDKQSASPANDPEAGQTPSTGDGGTGGTDGGSTDGGTVTPPQRETQDDILAACTA